MGTRSPQLEQHLRKHARHKHLLLLLNKCDLVSSHLSHVLETQIRAAGSSECNMRAMRQMLPYLGPYWSRRNRVQGCMLAHFRCRPGSRSGGCTR
jgi:hypothetical protein